ncbi:aspartic peptidase domain-containing protein [Mycena leptocephala]|nr:aspartic peptidase domain-containing protein [Mycena leptocephala]
MHSRTLIVLSTFAGICAGLLHLPVSRTIFARTSLATSSIRAANGLSNLDRMLTRDFNLTILGSETGYYTSLDVGTPPQTFNLLVDILAADMMVVGTSCTAGCPTPVAYDANRSSTAVNISTDGLTTIDLGSGTANVYAFTDTMTLGQYTISNATFLEVTHTSNNFFFNPISGLLGLGFVTRLQNSNTPFWEAIISGNETASPEFSFWLPRGSGLVPQDPSLPGGIFTFGGTNPSFYSGDIEFFGAVPGNTGSWSLYISSITIEGQFISLVTEGMVAGFDTNTEGIIGPSSVVQTMGRGSGC